MPIENISDTARWVAVYRAAESARRDALFRDPFAERLAGSRGAEIVSEMKKGRSLAAPMIVRTAVFDEIIMDHVMNRSVDTVINLAAGLDTRAWRLPLPATLRWFDVDLPGITEYKAAAMRGERPACAYEAIAADLTDADVRSAVLQRCGALATTALVVTEGLLIYLSAEQVAALARDIHDVQAARWWLFDMASPDLLQIMNRHWGKAVAAGSAPFRFAPKEGTRFFEPLGWREAVARSGLGEGRRLRREMPMMPLWRLLSMFAPPERKEAFRRMSLFVVLEREP